MSEHYKKAIFILSIYIAIGFAVSIIIYLATESAGLSVIAAAISAAAGIKEFVMTKNFERNKKA